MKPSNKTFFRIHSWIGINFSILLFVVCFSGTLATVSNELDWLFIPECRATVQEGYASKNTIRDNLKATYPDGEIKFWAASPEPYLCDIIHVNIAGQRYYVFANPYTGQLQGKTTLTIQRFFRDFHRSLFLPFRTGIFAVSFFSFLLLFSLLTALVFFKKWWRKFWVFKRGKADLSVYRSLHRLVGLWSIPFIVLFSLTGVWYFSELANVGGLLKRGNPPIPTFESSASVVLPEEQSLSYQIDYDRAVSVATELIPDLEVKDIIPAQASNGSALYLTGRSQVPLVRNRANRIYLHPINYEVLGIQRAESISYLLYINDIVDPLHFGYWGGIPTKLIWFLAGLAISGLILTGIWIALKRKKWRQNKTERPGKNYWDYFNGLMILVALGYMYYYLIIRYAAGVKSLMIISLFIAFFFFLAWFIFGYRLRKSAVKERIKRNPPDRS